MVCGHRLQLKAVRVEEALTHSLTIKLKEQDSGANRCLRIMEPEFVLKSVYME